MRSRDGDNGSTASPRGLRAVDQGLRAPSDGKDQEHVPAVAEARRHALAIGIDQRCGTHVIAEQSRLGLGSNVRGTAANAEAEHAIGTIDRHRGLLKCSGAALRESVREGLGGRVVHLGRDCLPFLWGCVVLGENEHVGDGDVLRQTPLEVRKAATAKPTCEAHDRRLARSGPGGEILNCKPRRGIEITEDDLGNAAFGFAER